MGRATTLSKRSTKTRSVSVQIGTLLQTAVANHQAGNLKDAESAYMAVLAAVPDQADALQLLGVLRHQQGKDEEAVALLRRAVASQPDYATIRTNFGRVLRDLDRLYEAETEFAAAVRLAPAAETHFNHGIVLEQQQRYEEARGAFAACLSCAPDYLRGLRGMSTTLLRLNRAEEAESYLRRVAALQPEDPEMLGNLAISVQMQGRAAEAESLFRAAIEKATDKPALRNSMLSLINFELRDEETRAAFREMLRADPEAWKMEVSVANRLLEIGRLEHAQQIIDDILAVHGADSVAWNETGTVLLVHGKHKESEAYFRRAIELDPRSAAAYCNLGSSHLARHELESAIAAFRESLNRSPAAFQAQISMIRALRLLRRMEEAHIYARSALDLIETAPHLAGITPESRALLLQFLKSICDFDGLDQFGDVWSVGDSIVPSALPAIFLDSLVFADTSEDVQRMLTQVKRWGAHNEGLAAQTPLPPREVKKPKEKLRIGILSSDLREHSVTRFIKPFFEGYDRDKIELYCYSPVSAEADAMQQKLAGLSTSFKYVEGLTDREAAEMIQNDDVDILIELNGFTQFTRLSVLAYKPAPVQMSWLGYPFTSGLSTIDYVILDRFVAPRDETTLTEQALIMPDAWVCFGKFADVPVNPELPMDRNGVVTFGTLNNPYKFNRKNIEMWARVMCEVPDSRFLLVRPEVTSVTLIKHVATEFMKHGISSDRIYLRDNFTEGRNHLSYYNEIDISLDTFPLTGGTTTCEAIWMGVPVVSFVGDAFHQRISYSALMQCGLEELCTFSHDSFVARAVRLVGEREKLIAWRSSLRDVMRASPLCDEQRFLHQFQDMLGQVADLHGLR